MKRKNLNGFNLLYNNMTSDIPRNGVTMSIHNHNYGIHHILTGRIHPWSELAAMDGHKGEKLKIPLHIPQMMVSSSSSLSLCVPTRKTEMTKSKSFLSVASSVWNKLPGHLSSISTLPAFRKRLKHHLFLSAFPGNLSPSTGITFCDVSPSTDATQVGHTPPPG